MTMYQVIKIYQDDRLTTTVKSNLSLKEAQTICFDPETSSMTARKPIGCNGDEKQIKRWHDKQKHWFYGYREM